MMKQPLCCVVIAEDIDGVAGVAGGAPCYREERTEEGAGKRKGVIWHNSCSSTRLPIGSRGGAPSGAPSGLGKPED